MALPQRNAPSGRFISAFSASPPPRHFLLCLLLLLVTVTFVSTISNETNIHQNRSLNVSDPSSTADGDHIGKTIRSSEEDNSDDDNVNYTYDDESADADESDDLAAYGASSTTEDVVVELSATSEATSKKSAAAEENSNSETVLSNEEDVEDEDDFCGHNYVDSAYFNGYDTILTRGDRLWYYYKEPHKLSKAYDQRRFTQGDHIQGAFNISRTPRCGQAPFSRSAGLSTAAVGASQPPPPLPDTSSVAGSHSSSPANIGDCKEISKMQAMAVYFLHNKERSRSYYNLDVRNANGTQKRVRSRDLPWGMKQVGLLGGNMWPNGWESYQAYRPVAFLPSRLELIFIMNHYHSHDHFDALNGSTSADAAASSSHRSTALLTWNTLDTTSWNSSWRSRVLTHNNPVVYTGMFEMNGIVYAIGESRQPTPSAGKQKRVGKIYRYYVTEDDGRDLRETDQSVRDFFGCPRRKGQPDVILPVISTSTTSSTTTTSTTTTSTSTTSTTQAPPTQPVNVRPVNLEDRDNDRLANKIPPAVESSGGNRLKSANVFLSSPSDSSNQIYSSVFLRNSKAKILPINGSNGSSNHLLIPPTAPGVTLRESDSILLTIFIGIIISACIATILLAFLTITGRKKAPPRFEGARIERTIPKPTIIGLDYQIRKNSSASSADINLMTRYDSMNSINDIYARIGKPVGNGAIAGHHQQQQSKKKSKPMNAYHTVDRLNGYGSAGNGGATHAKSTNSSSSPNHHFSGHLNGGATFQHFEAFQ